MSQTESILVKKQKDWIPLLIFISSIMISFLISYLYYNYEILQQNDQFLKDSDSIVIRISDKLQLVGTTLHGFRGIYEIKENVTREEYKKYYASMVESQKLSGVQGIGYQLETADKQVFVKSIDELKSLGLLKRDLPVIDDDGKYRLIFYIEPTNERNTVALGYDMYSNPIRREAIDKAYVNDLPSMSGAVTLVQEITKQKQRGFLLYLPVYKHGTNPSTLEERKNSSIGVVYAAFRTDDFLSETISDFKNMHICLYDSSISYENLIFSNDPDNKCQAKSTSITREIKITNYDRTWIASFHNYVYYEFFSPQIHLMILISGLILSAIFTIITRNYRKSIYEKTKLKLVQEKKDLEQKLIIENLENENREKTEFMSMISHELKTPLFTISGYAQILNNDQKTLNAQQKDDISEILTGINSLELIINDLLDAQKLDLKKLILEKSQINIRTLVLEVVKSLQPFFDKKSISNQIEISDDILLNCDPSRIAQILKNLLKNSVEAINHDHGLIKINVARQNDSVLFSVIDNGSGIPDTIAKNMFKKFYQIDSSLSRKKDGTGLGLYICQQLVLLHGGKIWYDSSPDKGTAFYFSIPW